MNSHQHRAAKVTLRKGEDGDGGANAACVLAAFVAAEKSVLRVFNQEPSPWEAPRVVGNSLKSKKRHLGAPGEVS